LGWQVNGLVSFSVYPENYFFQAMRHLFLILILAFASNLGLSQRSDQIINSPLVNPDLVNHSDPAHNHESCKTLELLNSEQGINVA
jgi:hypothetical protein